MQKIGSRKTFRGGIFQNFFLFTFHRRFLSFPIVLTQDFLFFFFISDKKKSQEGNFFVSFVCPFVDRKHEELESCFDAFRDDTAKDNRLIDRY